MRASRPVLGEAEGENPSAYSPHRTGAGQGPDHHGTRVGLRARRPSLRRCRSPGGSVPLLARPTGRAPAGTPRRLDRRAAGRRLWRLWQAVSRRAQARADPRGRVLGSREEKVLRAGRHRSRGAPTRSEEGGRHGAPGARGCAAHGRAVRHRARGERPSRGRATSGAAPALRPARDGSGRLDARRTGSPVARVRGGQSDGLHARPLAVLLPLPRRRTRLHE